MNRREFVALLGGAVGSPFAAQAQQTNWPHRIGVLLGSVANPDEAVANETLRPFKEAMQKAGWVEGKNIHVDYRFGGDAGKTNAAADDLVAVNPELIFAQGLPAARALHQRTSTIPVVFTQVADPVGFGLVQSFGRPGGNITGFVVWDLSIGGKWMQFLRQIAPDVKRVGALYNPDTAAYAPSLVSSANAAAGSGVAVIEYPVHNEAEIEAAASSIANEPHGGLLVIPEPFTAARRDQIINEAARHNLPNVVPLLDATKHGALLSYNYSFDAIMSEPVSYIDRILKGQSPGELPIQAPTKFELSINLKVAKALGLSVSPSLLDLADEIIE
jgi:putative tryptophan/tyrosine transport system substrate-binding protein